MPRPLAVVTLALTSLTVAGALAGPLDPPAGPITGTPGPEARTAINGVNTPGDANSLFRITQPGSYYLTGDVTGLSGKRGIEIAASNVTIDLNGFGLVGVAGSLDAIICDVACRNVSVRNGAVDSWGASGVNLNNVDANVLVEGVTVITCALNGVGVGPNGVVHRCSISHNGGAGIVASANAVIADCAVRENAGGGIVTGLSSTISNCSVRANGGDGINAGSMNTVIACSVYDNTLRGINASAAATVNHCIASNNGDDGIGASANCVIIDCSAVGNGGNGIQVIASCLIRGNLCSGNGPGSADGAGIFANGGDNRIEGNSSIGNDRGYDITGAGNIIVRNTCSGNTNNWNVVSGNRCLVVSAPAGAVGISGDSGGASLGSTDPNANFTY